MFLRRARTNGSRGYERAYKSRRDLRCGVGEGNEWVEGMFFLIAFRYDMTNMLVTSNGDMREETFGGKTVFKKT